MAERFCLTEIGNLASIMMSCVNQPEYLLYRSIVLIFIQKYGGIPKFIQMRMKLDKKALSGVLRLILWRGLGRADVVPDVAETAILHVLSG